jgi:hypothetical protein
MNAAPFLDLAVENARREFQASVGTSTEPPAVLLAMSALYRVRAEVVKRVRRRDQQQLLVLLAVVEATLLECADRLPVQKDTDR